MADSKLSSNPTVSAAQELYQKDKDAWSSIYLAAREDLEFYKGGKDQWDAADLKIRQDSKRPSLTTNMLPQFVHQVVNEIRQNVPTIKVLPVDDKADIETAKVYQGGIKNIEYTSNSGMVYDTAAENAIKCSIGFIRLDHDYENIETFDKNPLQTIKLKRVVNPLSHFIDSSSIECDGSDAKHGFALDPYSKSEFEKQWPGKEAVSFDSIDGTSDEMIIVAEFFKIVPTDVVIALMSNGTILTAEKAAELKEKPVATKTVKRNKVKRQKLSGQDVLEETDFPGCYIPIVPVYGEEHWIDGKRHLFSLIRHAKDPQRMVNSWASLETELLQKSPQAPFIMVEGQAEGHEDDWRNPGSKMVLQYKSVDVDGKPAPAPQRVAPPPVPTGVINARQTAIQDMRDAMGIQQAGLGMRSNETSGVAIANRVKEGDVSNMHFGDNLNRSITHCGRIILSMWPEIFDTPRIIRTLGDDDTPLAVGINGAMAPDQDRPYDLNAGRYDVAVIAGPSFSTRRQETQQMMTQVMTAAPQLIQVMGDLMFKYSDVPGSDVIAERLKKTIPPQLLEDDKNGPQIPPQVTQQMQQMQQQMQQMMTQGQQLQQELQQCQMELKNKQGEQQLKAKELEIKDKEVQIEAHRASMEAIQPPSPQSVGQPQQEGQDMPQNSDESIEVLHTKLQKAIADKQAQDEAAQQVQQQQAEAMAQQQAVAQAQAQQDAADKQEARARSDALLNGLMEIQKGIGDLVSVIQKPKTVMRDENGVIQGVH